MDRLRKISLNDAQRWIIIGEILPIQYIAVNVLCHTGTQLPCERHTEGSGAQ